MNVRRRPTISQSAAGSYDTYGTVAGPRHPEPAKLSPRGRRPAPGKPAAALPQPRHPAVGVREGAPLDAGQRIA